MRRLGLVMSALLLSVGLCFGALTTAFAAADEFAVSMTQLKNKPELKVAVVNPAGLSHVADGLKVELKMSYDGKTVQDFSASTGNISKPFTMNTQYFGSFQATVTFTKAGTAVSTKTSTVNIIADEYNIAALHATLPPLMLTMSLFGPHRIQLNSATGAMIPTVAVFPRTAMWNWNELPDGVTGSPYNTTDNAATAAYVKVLRAISPQAKFHFYINDYWIGEIFSDIYANRIPVDKYDVHLISDGAYSYNMVARVYNGATEADNAAINQGLIEKWQAAMQSAYATGKVPDGFDKTGPSDYDYAALTADPNILQWWVASKGMLKTTVDVNTSAANGTAQNYGHNSIQANPKVFQFGIAAYLASDLSAPTDQAAFKKLLNFGDTYFAKSEKDGKKIMLFLGTLIKNENGTFPDYARQIMEQYGSGYDYYYKGHPSTPTQNYPTKQNEESALGIDDVDSNIPAEIILFFYPQVTVAGWPTSTFDSLQSISGVSEAGLFGNTKAAQSAASGTSDYAGKFNWFISPVTASSDPAVRSLTSTITRPYLVEHGDNQTYDWDIAIWDPDTATTSYYKQSGSGYSFERSVVHPSGTTYVRADSFGVMTGYAQDDSILSGQHQVGGQDCVFGPDGSLLSGCTGVIAGITVKPKKVKYLVGDRIASADLTVTGQYAEGAGSVVLTPGQYTLAYDFTKASARARVTVSLAADPAVSTAYTVQVTAQTPQPGTTTAPVYRLYNTSTGEHFYTVSAAERDKDIQAGWRSEGVGWTAPTSGTPVYRLYNPRAKGGDHYYTKNKAEADKLVQAGWKRDNQGRPVFCSGGSVKVYVAYNPNAKSGAHNYTKNQAEQDGLLKAGWKYGATAWYAIK